MFHGRIQHVLRLLAICTMLMAARPLIAQQVTVQQPVFEVFSSGTTVSVPDRGRAFMGGVGSAASSRSTYGPLRTNSNSGRSTAGSQVSVSAWIQNFEQLDRQALQSAGDLRRAAGPPLGQHAEHAYQSLVAQHRDNRPSVAALGPLGRPAQSAVRTAGSSSREPAPLSGDELYRRGIKAEAAGQRGVALAFLRMARDRGSHAAREHLHRSDSPGTAASAEE